MSEGKDIEIQQLHADVERLGNQVNYLNRKMGVLQWYLQWTKVCVVKQKLNNIIYSHIIM